MAVISVKTRLFPISREPVIIC